MLGGLLWCRKERQRGEKEHEKSQQQTKKKKAGRNGTRMSVHHPQMVDAEGVRDKRPTLTTADWLKTQTNTPRHREYEYNRATGETRWPGQQPQPQQEVRGVGKARLSGTWEPHPTPKGTHVYEVNSETGESRWAAQQPMQMQANPMARRR